MKRAIAICAGGVTFLAVQAFADNFRCPNGAIVSTGDSISVVAAKCDPPAATFKHEEPVETGTGRVNGRDGSSIVYIEVQEWTYNKGSSLLHYLVFRNGTLAEIRTGGFVQ